ncbi:hypothetical protein M0R45_004965 [Rubus argutus]|uniref:Uncharacterized protein n=1 Tax=Rubus argutus TaxID=59490 RepID=A0AAW1YLA6_RUBAR
MGRKTKLSELLMGAIKDKASQSKAAILSKLQTTTTTTSPRSPSCQSLQLALLRATTHDPFSPPSAKHLATLLSFGHSSRATASAAIEAHGPPPNHPKLLRRTQVPHRRPPHRQVRLLHPPGPALHIPRQRRQKLP